MPRIVLAATALAVAILASPAAAYLARNGLVVEAVSAESFHIPYRGPSGATAFWCAAGDYAAAVLGAAGNARIWRLTPVPRKSGQPMAFSMQPEGAFGKTGLIELGDDDGGHSVTFARALCLPVQ